MIKFNIGDIFSSIIEDNQKLIIYYLYEIDNKFLYFKVYGVSSFDGCFDSIEKMQKSIDNNSVKYYPVSSAKHVA